MQTEAQEVSRCFLGLKGPADAPHSPIPCYSLGMKWPTSPLGQNPLHRHIRLKDYNVHLAQHKQVRLEGVAARPRETLQAESPVRETALLNSSSTSSCLARWTHLGSCMPQIWAQDFHISCGLFPSLLPAQFSPSPQFCLMLQAGGQRETSPQQPG